MDSRSHCAIVLSLLYLFFCSSAAQGVKEQLPAALVVGKVYCDTCFHQESNKFSHFISGASVAIECGDAASRPSYRKVVRTDRHGVFRVRLPPKISKHLRVVEACSVKLMESNEPFCAVASSATAAAGLRLKSRRPGVHVYSAGFFSFKPMNQPELCYQKPALLRDQKGQFVVFFPLPTVTFQPSPPSTGPTNPFLPPSNPLQPPPSVLPPFNFPPVFPHLLTPPPAAALPFPPSPRLPGVPPTFSSKKTSP